MRGLQIQKEVKVVEENEGKWKGKEMNGSPFNGRALALSAL